MKIHVELRFDVPSLFVILILTVKVPHTYFKYNFVKIENDIFNIYNKLTDTQCIPLFLQ